MSQQGRFVSPEDLEASIFSERGVASSPKRFENRASNRPANSDQSTSRENQFGDFSLSVDMGTYDKFKSMEQRAQEKEKESEAPSQRRRPGHNLVRRCFPPVGLSLVLEHPLDIEPGPVSKKAIYDRIRTDLSMALKATDDRIRIISIEKGNLVVNLNILGDLGGDPRSPMQLACDVVQQCRDKTSALRNLESIWICSDALIRENPFPVPVTQPRTEKLRKSTVAKRTINDGNSSSRLQSNEVTPDQVSAATSSSMHRPAEGLEEKEDEFCIGPSDPPR